MFVVFFIVLDKKKS